MDLPCSATPERSRDHGTTKPGTSQLPAPPRSGRLPLPFHITTSDRKRTGDGGSRKAVQLVPRSCLPRQPPRAGAGQGGLCPPHRDRSQPPAGHPELPPGPRERRWSADSKAAGTHLGVAGETPPQRSRLQPGPISGLWTWELFSLFFFTLTSFTCFPR